MNWNTLKKWWPTLIPAAVAGYHTLSPQIALWVHAHPSATVWISAGAVFVSTFLRSPLAQQELQAPPRNILD